LVQRLRGGELSAEELVRATFARVEAQNPALNAIVTLCPERALDAARAADARRLRGEPLGPLHGLPIAHKDLVDTAGIRTTYGSPLFRDHVPQVDELIVERLRGAGAIAIGKTNTPEFGAGSQTFNPVFGATRNPYDHEKTCGGSSGGAAVALAAGMLSIADGSDMGGSLRNPASFCNVVGLRPSPGRVPRVPATLAWSGLAVLGPMARRVEDCALLLSAMAGPDRRDPISLPEAGERFREPLGREFRGVRVAWSRDLGGLPVDRRVRDALEAKRPALDALGCSIEDAEPNFDGADAIFQVLRAFHFAAAFRDLGPDSIAELKETLVWNIEAGRKLRADDVADAEIRRGALYQRFATFQDDYEFLLAPVVQVPPFDLDVEWIREIEGVAMETYIDWMRSCFYISLLGNPAISVPFAFTNDGLPIGLQIVGRLGDDFGLLQFAHAVEQAVGTPQPTTA
jgi:amidase